METEYSLANGKVPHRLEILRRALRLGRSVLAIGELKEIT